MISILFPLYNERENVVNYNIDLFPIIDDIAQKTGEKFEFVFIDDGSQDDTVEQIREIARSRNDVTLLVHQKNCGMGTAIKTGLGSSQGESYNYDGCRPDIPTCRCLEAHREIP